MPTSPADPRVVGVVAAVGGQVERDRQPLLPGGEVAPVERVRLLGGGEPGVLADGPRLGRVHRRVGPAQERRDPRIRPEEIEPGGVVGGVERPDPDALRGVPRRRLAAPARPSAAFQASRPDGAAAPSRGTVVKSGIIGDPPRFGPPVEYRVHPAQHREGVAARGGARRPVHPRLAREQHVPRPGGAQAGDDGRGALGVERVGRAQHRDGRARLPEGGDHVVDGLGGPRVDGVDPPGVQQVAGEPGARGVGGRRAEGGEERARPGTGGGEVRVGPVAERLVRGRGPVHGQAPAQPSPRPASRSGPDRGTGFSCRSGNSLTPGHGRPAGRGLLLPPGPDGRGAVGHQPGVERRDDPARGLELLEERPGRAGELVGQRLDEPRAARGVDHPRQVRLHDQQRLGVAGDPAGERRRRPERGVERRHRDRVGTPDARPRTRRPCPAAGSRTGRGGVYIVGDATACTAGRAPPRCQPAPLASSTRAHRRRAARSFAMVGNCSAVTATRSSSRRAAASTPSPAAVSARR